LKASKKTGGTRVKGLVMQLFNNKQSV
jgi:hypothetical protein